MDVNADGRLDLWEYDRKLPRFLQTKLEQSDQLPTAVKEDDVSNRVKEDDVSTAVGIVPTATFRAKLLALEEARDLLTDEEYARARREIVDSFSA